MRNLIISVFTAVLLSACGSANVRDIDPGKEGIQRINGKEVEAQPTPFNVHATHDNITVEVNRWGTIKYEGVEQEVWDVTYENEKSSPRCVLVVWRLMDFDFQTTEPAFVYLRAKEKRHVGRMIQHVWDIDGVKFVLPPSGQVSGIATIKPVPKAPSGEECTFFDDRKVKEM